MKDRPNWDEFQAALDRHDSRMRELEHALAIGDAAYSEALVRLSRPEHRDQELIARYLGREDS